MLRNLLLLFFIIFSPVVLLSQQIPQYTLYTLNPYAYNPAYSAASDYLEANGVFRKQWLGLEGSPTTQNFNIHLPINYLSSGIGMNIENDMIGALRISKLSLGYAYGFKIAKDVKLSIGLSGGVLQSSLDGTKLLAPDGEYGGSLPIHNDNLLPDSKINAISYEIDAGFYIKTATLDAGISVLHLTGSKVDYSFNDVTDFNYLPHYIGFTSYKIDLNNKIRLVPSIMVKTDFVQTQMDFTVYMEYDNKYLIGTAYRGYNKTSNDAISALAGIQITNEWRLAYGYDFSLSGLKAVNQGSHEIMLKYQLEKIIGKGKLPKIIHNPRLL